MYAVAYGTFSESVHGSWQDVRSFSLRGNVARGFSPLYEPLREGVGHVALIVPFATLPFRGWANKSPIGRPLHSGSVGLCRQAQRRIIREVPKSLLRRVTSPQGMNDHIANVVASLRERGTAGLSTHLRAVAGPHLPLARHTPKECCPSSPPCQHQPSRPSTSSSAIHRSWASLPPTSLRLTVWHRPTSNLSCDFTKPPNPSNRSIRDLHPTVRPPMSRGGVWTTPALAPKSPLDRPPRVRPASPARPPAVDHFARVGASHQPRDEPGRCCRRRVAPGASAAACSPIAAWACHPSRQTDL